MDSLHLNVEIQDHFRSAASVDSTAIEKFYSDLKGLDVKNIPLLSAGELRELLEARMNEEEAASFAQVTLNVLSYKRHKKMSSDRVIKALKKFFLELDSDETQILSFLDGFIEVLNAKALCVVEKAIGLSFDYQCLFKDFRVLTDIRPVFDDTRGTILGSIITHTVRLDFFDEGKSSTTSIAVDSDDLDSIIKACESAKKKAESGKSIMIEKVGVTALIVGEERYDSTS